jgi:hypothetical protein
MKWIPLAAIIAAGVALLGPVRGAQAQGLIGQFASPQRPKISPYTALGSRSPTMNYFNITRAQLETRSLLNRQEAELNRLDRTLSARKADGTTRQGQFEFTLQRTGHRVYFSNLSHYYPSR